MRAVLPGLRFSGWQACVVPQPITERMLTKTRKITMISASMKKNFNPLSEREPVTRNGFKEQLKFLVRRCFFNWISIIVSCLSPWQCLPFELSGTYLINYE